MKNKVNIVGAGLVGSLLSLTLQKKGLNVALFEKRSDPRKVDLYQGRSINLALSQRGINALRSAEILDKVIPLCTPMYGRMIHNKNAALTAQPYGKEHQCINSISRNQLNILLLKEAEKEGVAFYFGEKCEAVDTKSTEIHLSDGDTHSSDLIVGADGAYSKVRQSIQNIGRFDFSQFYIEHGYKEIELPAKNGQFALDPNFLHIWPRGKFMLIALPNTNKTFTCTLFLPFEGANSFASLETEQDVRFFFEEHFSDLHGLIPDLENQFFNNPTGTMVTTNCSPWHNNKTLLLGDAAHSIVPFFGQGMNAGFEDTRILTEIAAEYSFDWKYALQDFFNRRKKDTDAISELALQNFIEMRDWVSDEKFLKRKKLEAKLHEAFPETWIPLYSMVTFSDMPYSEALRLGKLQDRVMNEVAEEKEVNLDAVIARFNALKKA